MSDILDRILARKAEEVADRRRRQPLTELKARTQDAPTTRGFDFLNDLQELFLAD